jgi:hypothetical protein
MPSVPPKLCPEAQNMKKGPDDLVTAKNESGRAKHETEPNALDIAENESGSEKHEKGT